MTREELIRNLKYTMKKHKNDTVNTFGTNISVMCKDILDYLEQEPILEQIRTEIEGYKSTIDNAISEDELKIEGMKEAYAVCLEIIDKYRESEE